jgi:DNA-binding NarL/FixJ family response regulator
MEPSLNKSKTKIRILLADDHHLVRSGIHQLHESAGDMEVVAEAGDINEGKSALDPTITPQLMQDVFKQPDRNPTGPLTDREIDVLSMDAKGFTNKAIGIQLGVSERTVLGHLAHIFDKMHATSRTEAVMRAVSLGWISRAVEQPHKK